MIGFVDVSHLNAPRSFYRCRLQLHPANLQVSPTKILSGTRTSEHGADGEEAEGWERPDLVYNIRLCMSMHIHAFCPKSAKKPSINFWIPVQSALNTRRPFRCSKLLCKLPFKTWTRRHQATSDANPMNPAFGRSETPILVGNG